MKLKALVPMRDVSVRVENKNYRSFGNGLPLFTHVINSLLECKSIELVIINTDSKKIKQYCKKNYPQILIIDRPDYLVDGTISMNEIIKNDLNMVKGDFFLQTHSTNPLVRSKTFQSGIELFFENYPKYDSVFSVTKYQNRLWDSKINPINHDKNILLRTQDLEPLYEENSCFYIFERENFLNSKNRIGNKPLFFNIDKYEAQDIDYEVDFFIAEKIYAYQKQSQRN